MADIYGFGNLPELTPTGSMLLAIEDPDTASDDEATGKSTVDDVVGAATPVAGLNGLAFVKGTVANDNTLTLTLSGNTRGVVYCTSNYAAGRGEYILGASTATANTATVLEASGLTVTTSGLTVSIANAAGGNVAVSVLVFNGTVDIS